MESVQCQTLGLVGDHFEREREKEMWGDPQVRTVVLCFAMQLRVYIYKHTCAKVAGSNLSKNKLKTALSLTVGESWLATLLWQLSGPAHISRNDARWQELLHGYNVWVHVDSSSSFMSSCTQQMAQHAPTSSNLAALCLHVARMLNDLTISTMTTTTTTTSSTQQQHTTTTNNTDPFEMTNTIALVGKARATAGALNLLRILLHGTIVYYCQQSDTTTTRTMEDLEEALTYQSRDGDENHRGNSNNNNKAGLVLTDALLAFLSSVPTLAIQKVPELYDTTVLSLQLVLVLLSTQLYHPEPPPSSSPPPQWSRQQTNNGSTTSQLYLLKHIMKEKEQQGNKSNKNGKTNGDGVVGWSPSFLLQTCLVWQLERPLAPERSIARHVSDLTASVAHQSSRVGPDGMYETHEIVMAERPHQHHNNNDNTNDGNGNGRSNHPSNKRSTSILVDATRGVLVLSSTLILLPFRLMTLALGLLARSKRIQEKDAVLLRQLQRNQKGRHCNTTNHVLWLTESPVADLAGSLLLLLLHNFRRRCQRQQQQQQQQQRPTTTNVDSYNPFRTALAKLNDTRWQQQDKEQEAVNDAPTANGTAAPAVGINFESLFERFGSIVHHELGALLLYTLFQSSPSFGASLAVRSDLDTLVVPLLRTLYFGSSLRHYSGQHRHGMPFRSPSQLYLVLILLLLFSQDGSFGPDAFRRVSVPSVVWYKERNLGSSISLGSLLVLVVLRCITFNLNRMKDAFLLSNCCAVLLNLSPHAACLHEYTAERLVVVTASALSKYHQLKRKTKNTTTTRTNGGNDNNNDDDDDENDLTTPLGMYGEVSRTLLGLLRHCLSPKSIDTNVRLVYSLVYHQTQFRDMVVALSSSSSIGTDLKQVVSIIDESMRLLEEGGEAVRTTPQKAHQILEANTDSLKKVAHPKTKRDDFVFSYEEEDDPELFFVPYVWEVLVCTVSATTVEWDTSRIQIFDVQGNDDDDDNDALPPEASLTAAGGGGEFSKDIEHVV